MRPALKAVLAATAASAVVAAGLFLALEAAGHSAEAEIGPGSNPPQEPGWSSRKGTLGQVALLAASLVGGFFWMRRDAQRRHEENEQAFLAAGVELGLSPTGRGVDATGLHIRQQLRGNLDGTVTWLTLGSGVKKLCFQVWMSGLPGDVVVTRSTLRADPARDPGARLLRAVDEETREAMRRLLTRTNARLADGALQASWRRVGHVRTAAVVEEARLLVRLARALREAAVRPQATGSR